MRVQYCSLVTVLTLALGASALPIGVEMGKFIMEKFPKVIEASKPYAEAVRPVTEPAGRLVGDGLRKAGEIEAVRNAATSDLADDVTAVLNAPVKVIGDGDAWVEHKGTHTFENTPLGKALLGDGGNAE